MSKKHVVQREKRNSLKWVGILALLACAVVASYYFSAVPWPLKVIGWVVVVLISGAIFAMTSRGEVVVAFVKESRIELQKVVWPTRKEAGQITLIVIVVVFLAGIFLWGIDSMVVWCVGKATQLKN